MQENNGNTLEDLKQKVITQEQQGDFQSNKFNKIKLIVDNFLKNQDTENAIKALSLGALNMGSSDIHFEILEDKSAIIRFRIDGLLVDIFDLEARYYKLMLERVKHSSGLKLNITHIPQDGKFALSIQNKKMDIRVSTLPTPKGENIVCRVLDTDNIIIDFDDLGLFWTTKRLLERAINKKNGLILVTGPTGSGKTTTLYTILQKLNTREKKIITLEDPIEYEVKGIIQSEVDEKRGYTFQMGLKALLRQDPDIIMMGEIRDGETLDIATQASLTGHLVLSTLHTKSAGDTLDRIINMGLRPYILASALDTIIAQRLVRRICTNCKVEKEKTQDEENLIKNMMKELGMPALSQDNIKLYHGIGCEKCNNTGYKGRIGIYEILSLNEVIRNMIRDEKSSIEIIKEAKKHDMIMMGEDGILKAIGGYTTIQEVLKVI